MTSQESGDRIREIRIRARLSQTELARRLDISSATLSGYEMGKYCPRVDMFVRIFAACGYEVAFKPRGSDLNGWIPCSVRLPDRDDKYIVQNSKWGAETISMDYWTDGKWRKDDGVVAWQELPLMWKENR